MTRAIVVALLLAPAIAAAQPSATDEDLAGLGLDVDHPDDRVTISGFADVGFGKLLVPDTSLAAYYYPKESSFLIGNVDLYITKNLSQRWRSFLEVRYLYAPAGAKNADGTLVHATAPDPADLDRPINYGGISIERAYLEYDVASWLTLRAGTFLTPYGIWNVDHGSPTIIPVFRPFVIGENLFPKSQTGIDAFGSYASGSYVLRYHATLSNGRGPFDSFRDLDENKAIGARLELETSWFGDLRLGVSAYHGRFTDRPADQIGTDSNGDLINTTPAGTRYEETSYGIDALFKDGPIHVQVEVIANAKRYRDGERVFQRTGFLADSLYAGGYAVAGYRLDRWWQVMPFVMLEIDHRPSDPDIGHEPRLYQLWTGLNFRPDPSVVLKVNYCKAWVRAPAAQLDFSAVNAQAAWAF